MNCNAIEPSAAASISMWHPAPIEAAPAPGEKSSAPGGGRSYKSSANNERFHRLA